MFRQHGGRAGEFHRFDPEGDRLCADQTFPHSELPGLPPQPQIHRWRRPPGRVGPHTKHIKHLTAGAHTKNSSQSELHGMSTL